MGLKSMKEPQTIIAWSNAKVTIQDWKLLDVGNWAPHVMYSVVIRENKTRDIFHILKVHFWMNDVS